MNSEFSCKFSKHLVLAKTSQNDLGLECVIKNPAGSLEDFRDALTPSASSVAVQKKTASSLLFHSLCVIFAAACWFGGFLNFINRTMAGFYKTNPEAEVLRNAFNWIAQNFDINFPANPLSTSTFLATEEALEQASKLLKAFGTGIEDVKSVQVPLEKVAPFIPPLWIQNVAKQMELNNTQENEVFIRNRSEIFVVRMERGKKDKAYSIQFRHNFQNSTLFKMAEESDGTARLFNLLEILLSKSDKTYVIDELDRCLHP